MRPQHVVCIIGGIDRPEESHLGHPSTPLVPGVQHGELDSTVGFGATSEQVSVQPAPRCDH